MSKTTDPVVELKIAAREVVRSWYMVYPEASFLDGNNPAFPNLARAMSHLKEVLR
jgi:hypothetical protein